MSPTEVDGYDIHVGDAVIAVRSTWKLGEKLFTGQVNGRDVTVQVEVVDSGWALTHSGARMVVSVLSPTAAKMAALMPVKAAPDMSKYLLSPMPGLIMSLAVEEGDSVEAGEPLAIVEAMKMENVLRAERAGTIKKIHAQAGASVSADEIILEFE